jgi:hypothetical protein
MALLAQTDGFSKQRESILWGIAAGIGLLLKPPCLFFLILPVAWTVASRHQPGRMKNFVSAVGICLAISVPWYFWQGTYFFIKASSLAAEPTAVGTDPHQLSGWLFYLRLLRMQLGLPSLIFTGIGLAFALIRRPRGNILLWAWALSGFLGLSLLVNKDPRHSLAMLPALAILAVRGWGETATGSAAPVLLSIAGPLLLVWNMATYDLPAREDWKHQAILSLLVERHDAAEPFLTASILSHHPRFFARTLKWSALEAGIPLMPVSTGDSDASFAEYVITRPGNQGSEAAVVEGQWQELCPDNRGFKLLYHVIGTYRLPDDAEVIVYHREPHPQFEVSPLTREEIGQRIARALRQWVAGPLAVTVEASSQGLQEGRLERVHVTCTECTVKGLQIHALEIVAVKPWLNLYRLWDENRLGILGFESLKPTGSVAAADTQSLLTTVKGLQAVETQFRDGKIRVHARYRGWRVGATVHLEITNGPNAALNAVLDNVSIAGIPLPGWLLGKAHRQILWLYATPDFAGKILVDHVTLDQGQLRVNLPDISSI